MSDSLYIGERYKVDPASIRFSQEMVEFNRVHSAEEYEATKLSIGSSIGQLNPICVNSETGLVEDGRHRVKICKELGIDVECVQINGKLPKKTRLEVYNIDAMSGRDLNTAQRAVQAHKFSLATDESLDVCAARFKTNKRAVNSANSIAGLGRSDVLDAIMIDGCWKKPDGRCSKDLRVIVSILKAESEDITENVKVPEIHYEDYIDTPTGVVEFWKARSLALLSAHELSLLLIELMNERYKVKVDEDTGEVKSTTV